MKIIATSTITTSTGFVVEIYPAAHRMDDHVLSPHNGKRISKIIAPDGSSMMRLTDEAETIYDGLSDDARNVIDTMSDEQAAELGI